MLQRRIRAIRDMWEGNRQSKGFPMQQAGLHGVSPELCAQVDQLFASRGLGVNPYIMRRHKRRQLIFLGSLTDTELCRLGLRRDQIARHVFHDCLGD